MLKRWFTIRSRHEAPRSSRAGALHGAHKKLEHPVVQEAVEFTPDGDYVLTGGHDNFIRLFRTSDFSLAHSEPSVRVEYFHFSSDGRLLVTAHEDSGLVRLWLMISDTGRLGLYADGRIYPLMSGGVRCWRCGIRACTRGVAAKMVTKVFQRLFLVGLILGGWGHETVSAQSTAPLIPIEQGDRIVFIGNTFAERMQLFPDLEVLLTALYPEAQLTFRNLGWSADEVALQPRPVGFGDLHTHLTEQQADIIFAFFGMNESYAGPEGLPKFRTDLAAFLQELRSHKYNGFTPPRVVLVSSIAHEEVAHVPLDPQQHNQSLALYTDAMREVATEVGVRFIDLFTPMRKLVADPALGDLTINGIHLNDKGYWLASRLMLNSLGLKGARLLEGDPDERQLRRNLQRLYEAISQKNELFFLRWRAVNGEYIYGRRKEPFGVVDFPPEMAELERMIRSHEEKIRALAKTVSAQIVLSSH